ncbi:phospholipase D-like domain-containing protein [Cupriavidus sp. IDO]|uniref:phospholipase D-like domain-containing protein n=1 Tax=Cupriavidus sp. IDO TaxID=1539142 RepID=UPI001EE6A051|nr:phospholipase D-like domain-containing protein [Cupriavidus sp. IDO]
MSAAAEIAKRIPRPEGVRRLGQALWMMVGEPVQASGLLWARGVLGDRAEEDLSAALSQYGCLEGPNQILAARPLAEFLCWLWQGGNPEAEAPRLVWTLPTALQVEGVDQGGYLNAAVRVIEQAKTRLLLVAPFLESEGVGRIQRALLDALQVGVSVTVVTHGADDLTSWSSAALESLRRESCRLPGKLLVYTAIDDALMLLHSKLIVADSDRGIVGSANLTGKGFGRNLETGMEVCGSEAAEIERVVGEAVGQALVSVAFSTKGAA